MSFLLTVSRETRDKLTIYEALLKKWQPRLNLISSTTLEDIWERHFLDSAQLFDLVSDKEARVVDLGSGAGFPGAIVAIMGCSNVTLVERDRKKCSFLRTVSRETGVSFNVFEGDVRDYPEKADYITSRALASLGDLLTLSRSLIAPQTTCLFLKGIQVDKEISELTSGIGMTVLKKQSITSSEGVVLQLKDIVFR